MLDNFTFIFQTYDDNKRRYSDYYLKSPFTLSEEHLYVINITQIVMIINVAILN